MKHSRFLSVLLVLAATGAGAQVVRCVDPTGNVSYNDTGCTRGDRRSDVVLGPEATERRAEPDDYRRREQIESAERAARLQRESAETLRRQSAPPGGLVVIDPRAEQRAQAERDEAERRQRESQLAADEAWRQGYGQGYAPGYGTGYYRPPPPPPQDMRPRLRNCDAAGCRDNMGNHYNPRGNVDRYVRPDGQTCRPIGTTVVCQ